MTMKTTIAYLGPEGTFSHQAAQKCLESNPGNINLQPYPGIAQVLYAVENDETALGVVPAENSIEGSVNITLDLLARDIPLYIKAEIIIDIKHHLLSHSKDLNSVHTVMSHTQAIAQCRHFLETRLKNADILETTSTAEAVSRLNSHGEGLAAIGSPESHKIYQVPILHPDIGCYPHNQTRFLLVGRSPETNSLSSKTSLVLSLKKDRPGGLYDILGEFAKYELNLCKIESRPAKMGLGNYLFFIDCEAGSNHPDLLKVIDSLRTKTGYLKNLGSYRCIS